MRENRFVALRKNSAEGVAPGIAEAEMPGDFCLYSVNATRDYFGNPFVIVVIVGEQRQPGSEIFDLKILGAGGDEVLHFCVEYRGESKTQFPRILIVLVIDVPGKIDRAGADRDFHGL